MTRERSNLFGEAVEEYESARPDYPDELIRDVLNFVGSFEHALEIGAGTGKATTAFAAKGISITCLEPDRAMADELIRHCSNFPLVSVYVSTFESWSPKIEFDLIFAAQSWHWVDKASRLDLAHDALKSNGTLALFWNKYALCDPIVQERLSRIDHRYGIDELGHTPSETPFHFFDGEIEVNEGWPAFDYASDERFTEFVSRRYRRRQTYSKETYLDLLSSISAYRLLDDDRRADLFSDIANDLDQQGGTIQIGFATDLFMCRKTGGLTGQ